MELTKKDKEQLLKWGYLEEDIYDIEKTMGCIKILSFKSARYITFNDAIRMIGRKEWLSGIARTTFHGSAMRTGKNNRHSIYFERS